MINGTIFSPELETCNGKVYDYFVVTNNFVHAVAGVQRVDGVGMSPHFPARLLLRGDARRHQVRALIRPKRVPPTLMHGPQPKPPSYDSVLAELALVPLRLDNTVPDIATTKRIGTAMIDWLKLIRFEANTLSQENLEFRETHFVWRSAAAATASPWGITTTISAVWRGIAKRTIEAAATTARQVADSAQQMVVQMHARALTKAI